MAFPPVPIYPLGLDTDRTLFVVYNTSETTSVGDNLPWAQEIEIVPVGADEEEIWADNGFANISGELFYYDAVDKDGNNKVYRLKRCARNLGGKRTQFNPHGTWVRGFVIAEHHNQLAQALINIEEFIGINNSENPETLDYLIRNLEGQPVCDDDYECPDIVLNVDVIQERDGCTGTIIAYDLQINGFFKNFRIDFGDGNSTTSAQSGTHEYPPNVDIDIIATVSNDKCQIIQTPIVRENPEDPETEPENNEFNIDVPEPPDFPPIVIPDVNVPSTTITFPPIVFPCELGFGSFGDINIPSVITVEPPIPSLIEFSPIDIPSHITFSPIDIPSLINFGPAPEFGPIGFGPAPAFSPIDFGPAPAFSPIDFGPAPTFSPIEFGPAPTFSPIDFGPVSIPSVIVVIDDIPTLISVIDDIPTLISVVDDIPTLISVVDDIPGLISVIDDIPTSINVNVSGSLPSTITITGSIPSSISVDWGSPPGISVSWGSPPPCNCTVTVSCPSAMASRASARAAPMRLDENYIDPFLSMEINTQDLGIPSEIKISTPVFPDIKLVHDIPDIIYVQSNLPDEIRIVGHEIPSEILIVADRSVLEIPTQIELVANNLPTKIELDASQLPSVIQLAVPEKFPDIHIVGEIPTTIQVIGIPDAIEIKGNIPSEIILKPPTEAFEVPMVYKGAPIPVKFDFGTPSGEQADRPCFALVPCNN